MSDQDNKMCNPAKVDILLVEDNPDDAELAVRALKSAGITADIVTKKDGVEAFDYLLGKERRKICPTKCCLKLILLDLNLPRMNGIDLLKALREDIDTKLIPILILTNSREERDVLAAYRYGANSYIQKPVDFKGFTETMKVVGRYWMELNECAR